MSQSNIYNSSTLLRSRLYSLEPLGIGTSFVESFTSYLSRLAYKHHISVRDLMLYELLPCFNREYLLDTQNNNISAFWKDTSTLNSINMSTHDWIQILEKKTLRSDLRYLTLFTWSNVLSPRYLLRQTKAWCPLCYEEWLKGELELYEPLVWSIEAVTSCTFHNCYLSVDCPNLDCKRSLYALAPQMLLGYCPYCGCFLGEGNDRTIRRTLSEDESRRQKWIVETIGQLFVIAPNLSMLPKKEIFAHEVEKYLNENADGNISALARELNVSRRTIRDWKKGRQVPQLGSFLRFCSLLGTSPHCLFGQGVMNVASPKTYITEMLEAKPKEKRLYRVFHGEKVRLALEVELLADRDTPLPMVLVAKQLEYDHSYLRKYFPELCCKISERYRVYRKKRSVERRQKVLDKVRQTTFKVHSQGLYPSHERVRRLLEKSCDMREPRAIVTWRQALQELGLEAKDG